MYSFSVHCILFLNLNAQSSPAHSLCLFVMVTTTTITSACRIILFLHLHPILTSWSIFFSFHYLLCVHICQRSLSTCLSRLISTKYDCVLTIHFVTDQSSRHCVFIVSFLFVSSSSFFPFEFPSVPISSWSIFLIDTDSGIYQFCYLKLLCHLSLSLISSHCCCTLLSPVSCLLCEFIECLP